MSGSVGYTYSPAAIEAAKVRTLRAEMAELRVRVDQACVRAGAAGVTAKRHEVNSAGDSTQLAAEIQRVRTVVAEIEKDAEAAWNAHWHDRVQAMLPRREREERTATPGARPAASAAPAWQEMARQSAIHDVRTLLEQEGHRCVPQDLDALVEQARSLDGIEDVDRLRTSALRIGKDVHHSIARRKDADAAERRRESLLVLVKDAPDGERASLVEAITSTDDPESLAVHVHQAVERADFARHRESVAAAAAAALRAAGCRVEDGFATALAVQREAVVGLREAPAGYGLLVRLPEDSAELVAAVVRAGPDDAMTEQRRAIDIDAQTGFCEKTLPTFLAELRRHGVDVSERPFLVLNPGERPVGRVPPQSIPRAKRRDEAPDRVQRTQLRERHRGA